MNRREFLAAGAAAAGGAVLAAGSAPRDKLIWGILFQLSHNMWEDRAAPGRESRYFQPDLQFDDDVWVELTRACADNGLNLVVIDLGDGVKYESHPEIAVKNAWTTARLKQELARLRSLGLEPIPKLNFSTCHDAWLGPYSRMVSTDVYYGVVRDLISEVGALFDKPRFFHLGMDEETAEHQRDYAMLMVRQFELWWHDITFYFDEVRKAGARPWIWSDAIWHRPDEFLAKMPRDVVQSNWYYGVKFEDEPESRRPHVTAYRTLDQHGYDQIPTGSNHSSPENFGLTVDYALKTIDRSRLLGFLQTPWRKTMREFREHHLAAIAQVGAARKRVTDG